MATIQFDPMKIRPSTVGQAEFLNFCHDLVVVLEKAGLNGLNCTITGHWTAEFRWQGVVLPRLEWENGAKTCRVHISYPHREDMVFCVSKFQEVVAIFADEARHAAQQREATDREIADKLLRLSGKKLKRAVVRYHGCSFVVARGLIIDVGLMIRQYTQAGPQDGTFYLEGTEREFDTLRLRTVSVPLHIGPLEE